MSASGGSNDGEGNGGDGGYRDTVKEMLNQLNKDKKEKKEKECSKDKEDKECKDKEEEKVCDDSAAVKEKEDDDTDKADMEVQPEEGAKKEDENKVRDLDKDSEKDGETVDEDSDDDNPALGVEVVMGGDSTEDDDSDVKAITPENDDAVQEISQDSSSSPEVVEEIIGDDEDDLDDDLLDQEVQDIMEEEQEVEEVLDEEDEDEDDDGEPKKKKSKKSPSTEPEIVELSDDEEKKKEGEKSKKEEEEDDEVQEIVSSGEDDEDGDPNRAPGEDCTTDVDPAHLVPFRFGWKREVVQRNSKGQVTQYDVYYLPPLDAPFRTREAKRKRRSKLDQQKYFDDFPSKSMSVANFSYVRRPLGLNNAAYEVVRRSTMPPEPKAAKRKPTATVTSAEGGNSNRQTLGGHHKGGKKSYREVDESQGLLTDSEAEEEEEGEIVFKEGWDIDIPLTLQASVSSEGMRAQHRRRRKARDPETCCTPPLVSDQLWTELDDDPMGVFTALGGRSSPATPPPLRAMKLTRVVTAEKIEKEFEAIREEAKKVVTDKEQEQKENLASHDYLIRKYKNYHPPKPLRSKFNPGLRPAVGNHVGTIGSFNQRRGSSNAENLVKPCNMFCVGQAGVLPTLQCITCKCLFHPKCQKMPSSVRAFKCKACVQQQQRKPNPMQIPGGSGSNTYSGHRTSLMGMAAAASQRAVVKVRLPMTSSGKRPLVELVMEQGGKYKPIKFSNNMQVTETIPRAMFDRANSLRRQVYQKALQVPRIGTKQIYLCINPSTPELFAKLFPMVKPLPPPVIKNGRQTAIGNLTPMPSVRKLPLPAQYKPKPPAPRPAPAAPAPPAPTDQVAILVRPTSGPSSKPLLLNLPRKVAIKVKVGTTLSFSASNDSKYKVLDKKLHPAVKTKSLANGGAPPGSGPPRGQKRSLPVAPASNYLPSPSTSTAAPSTFRSTPLDSYTSHRMSQVRKIGQTTITPAQPPKSISLQRMQQRQAIQRQQMQKQLQMQQRTKQTLTSTTANPPQSKWKPLSAAAPGPSRRRAPAFPTAGAAAGRALPNAAPLPLPAGFARGASRHTKAKAAPKPRTSSAVLASGEVVASQSEVTPCTPYCPGASGFPELECTGCATLFHSKCIGIPPSAVKRIMATFKCRMCSKASPEVVDLE